MRSLTDVDKRADELEGENQRLRDQVNALETALGRRLLFKAPAEWRLTASEAKVFAALYEHDRCSKDELMDALYSDAHDEPGIKIVDIFLCKIRKKVAAHGVTIETIWSRGYRMTPQVKALVDRLISQANAAESSETARAD